MSYKMRLSRFFKSYVTLDLRSDDETRRARCERFAKRNKTCGKPAVFGV